MYWPGAYPCWDLLGKGIPKSPRMPWRPSREYARKITVAGVPRTQGILMGRTLSQMGRHAPLAARRYTTRTADERSVSMGQCLDHAPYSWHGVHIGMCCSSSTRGYPLPGSSHPASALFKGARPAIVRVKPRDARNLKPCNGPSGCRLLTVHPPTSGLEHEGLAFVPRPEANDKRSMLTYG